MGHISDERMLARATRGERDALDDLTERYDAMVLGYLYHLVGGRRPR